MNVSSDLLLLEGHLGFGEEGCLIVVTLVC